jgi:hypothetical protein
MNSHSSKPTFSPSRCFLAIGMIVSALLLNGCQSEDGWLSLGAPTSGVARIVAATGNEIWVESNDGILFNAMVTFNCESGPTCWTWTAVNELPNYATDPILPIERGPDCTALVPQDPVVNPTGNLTECIYSPRAAADFREDFYFALMSDGNIMFLNNSSSYAPFVIISALSALGLPCLVVFVVIALIVAFFSMRSKRSVGKLSKEAG